MFWPKMGVLEGKMWEGWCELVFMFGSSYTSVSILVKIDQEMRL